MRAGADLDQPLVCHRLEGLVSSGGLGVPIDALRLTRVDPLGQLLARIVAAPACGDQRYGRVHAQRQSFALPQETVIHAPVFASLFDEQVHTPAIRMLAAGRLAGFCLLDKSVCESHDFSLDGTFFDYIRTYRQKYRQIVTLSCYDVIRLKTTKSPLSL